MQKRVRMKALPQKDNVYFHGNISIYVIVDHCTLQKEAVRYFRVLQYITINDWI